MNFLPTIPTVSKIEKKKERENRPKPLIIKKEHQS
jgi:hypothetical protein